ncbi:MAG TPA: hypothetical protein PLA08_00690 [Candidatus Cloacimonadota bacterium]|nr:hypothetical protein [Candidatus Cloacimonadota bacterium]
MAITYKEAKQLFEQNSINTLIQKDGGLRFLKLRSMSRKDNMVKLFKDSGLTLPQGGRPDLLQIAYNSNINESQIESIIRRIYANERTDRKMVEDELINELYKLQSFDWGGLYQNNLDKTIVNNYVKKIRSYEELESKIESELLSSLYGYVKCSWYNHWTSIIIEDIFKDHASILPAVGLVKQIDFFYRNIPLDLKVTYLPEGYVIDKRKEAGLDSELKVLKRCARDLSISAPREKNDSKLLELLWRRISDHPDIMARSVIKEIKSFRDNIVSDTVKNPTGLIKWLYENQGTRRFDASNRLFLVLVNKSDYFNSWKLKRAKPMLMDGINSFLNNGNENLHKVNFQWEGANFTVTAGIIILVQDSLCLNESI